MHVHVGHRRPRQGHPRRQRDARPRPGAARAERQLAVLARPTRPGCVSTRTPIFRAFPRVGIPPTLRRLGRLRARGSTSWSQSGVMEDYTYLWYDVRPHPKLRHGRDPRVRRADARRAHARARRAHPGDGQGAGRALRRGRAALATTRGRCSTRTSGSPRATGSTASSSTCPTDERVADEGARAARCSTACASTPQDLGSADELEAIEDLLARGNGARRQRRRLRGQPRPRARSWPRSSTRPRPTETAGRGPLASAEAWPPAPISSSSARTAGPRSARTSPSARTAGTRLRKRAPKIERDGAAQRKPAASGRAPRRRRALARAAAHRRDPRHPRRRAAPGRARRSCSSSSAASGGWR